MMFNGVFSCMIGVAVAWKVALFCCAVLLQ